MAGGHHLILGTLTDFLTGDILDDTLDERYRQHIAKLLIDQKGYHKTDIRSRQRIPVSAGTCRAFVPLDFLVHLSSTVAMVIKYGPGSIVTRRRPALALSRICAPYQVPVVVVTNGETAEVIDGESGKLISGGFDGIPVRHRLEQILKTAPLARIHEKRFEMESRILFAFEVDGACPCDETICRV